jgi:hypothetical protein
MAGRDELKMEAIQGILDAQDEKIAVQLDHMHKTRSDDMQMVIERLKTLTAILSDFADKWGELVVSIHKIECALLMKLGVDTDEYGPPAGKKRKDVGLGGKDV